MIRIKNPFPRGIEKSTRSKSDLWDSGRFVLTSDDARPGPHPRGDFGTLRYFCSPEMSPRRSHANPHPKSSRRPLELFRPQPFRQVPVMEGKTGRGKKP